MMATTALVRLQRIIFTISLIRVLQSVELSDLKQINSENLCRRCYCGEPKKIDCKDRNIESFNITGHWKSVDSLDLSSNKLRYVPDLHAFPNLKYLHLEENHHIRKLKEKSFSGVPKLERLYLSWLGLDFQNGSIHKNALKPLKRLIRLRLKQSTAPSRYADYSFLLPVKDTLLDLFAIGNSKLVAALANFTALQNVSLGGRHCYLRNLSNNSLSALQKLPLLKLSLRNCRMLSVSADYFQPLASSLQRLDISCNPLHKSIANITSSLKEGVLTTFIGEYINHKNESCQWNLTYDFFLRSMQITSLRGNHITAFVSANNKSDPHFMKNLLYIDVSYNNLGGSAFNFLRTQCKKEWFWCNPGISHQLQFIGMDALASQLTPSCGKKPYFLHCDRDSYLFIGDDFDWHHVTNPNYLDAFVFVDFFETLSNESKSIPLNLSNHSILGLFYNSVIQHSDMISWNDTVDAIKNILAAPGQEKHRLVDQQAKKFCEKGRIILVETMTNWIHLTQSSLSWPDHATNYTINQICQANDWRFGIDFFKNKKFRWFLTNLTTISAHNNDGRFLRHPNEYCNNVEFYYNNVRHLDLSYSNIPNIACSNITGLDALESITCVSCENEQGWTLTHKDIPNLRRFDWSGNNMGHYLQQKRLFEGFSKLETLILSNQTPQIGHFKHSDMFSDQPLLSMLDLSNCGINVWNISLKDNTRLQTLDLTNNLISNIAPRFRKDLEKVYNRSHQLQVYLEGNQINCTCNPSNVGMVRWLSSSIFISDRHKLKCSTPINRNFSSFLHSCAQQSSYNWKIPVAIGASGLVAFLSIILITIKCIKDHRKKGYTQLPAESPPTAFISYPQRMTDDINALKEKSKDRLVLFSSDSDFPLGALLSSGLSYAIRETDKKVLVVSEDYYQDSITSREYYMMQKAGLIKRGKVVLILTSATFSSQLPPVLKDLYDKGDFLVWPAGFCADRGFNQLVEDIIRHVKS